MPEPMHEYSLMERVFETLAAEVGRRGIPGTAVEEVALQVGALEIHSEEAFRQAFTMFARGTPFERSRLRLEILPGSIECPGCGWSGPLHDHEDHAHDPLPVAECPRCGAVSGVRGGRGVGSIEIVLKEDRKPGAA